MEVHPFGVENAAAAQYVEDVQNAIKPIAAEDIQSVFGSDVGESQDHALMSYSDTFRPDQQAIGVSYPRYLRRMVRSSR